MTPNQKFKEELYVLLIDELKTDDKIKEYIKKSLEELCKLEGPNGFIVTIDNAELLKRKHKRILHKEMRLNGCNETHNVRGNILRIVEFSLLLLEKHPKFWPNLSSHKKDVLFGRIECARQRLTKSQFVVDRCKNHLRRLDSEYSAIKE